MTLPKHPDMQQEHCIFTFDKFKGRPKLNLTMQTRKSQHVTYAKIMHSCTVVQAAATVLLRNFD